MTHVGVGDGVGSGTDGAGKGEDDGAGDAALPGSDDVGAWPACPAEAARPAPGEPPGAAAGWAGSERVCPAARWPCAEFCPAAGDPG